MYGISSIISRVRYDLVKTIEAGGREIRSPAFWYAVSGIVLSVIMAYLLGLYVLTYVSNQIGSPGFFLISNVLIVLVSVALPTLSRPIAWFEKVGKNVADSVDATLLHYLVDFESLSKTPADEQFPKRATAPALPPPRRQARVNLNAIIFSLNSGRSYGAV